MSVLIAMNSFSNFCFPMFSSCLAGPFAAVTFSNTNVSSYADPTTQAYAALSALAVESNALINDPKYTMIGENINILKDSFQASKDAGKPWQIWAGATMMGPNKALNLARCSEVISNATLAAAVQQYCDGVLASASGAFFRSLTAMDIFDIPWNADDFNGYGVERAAILDMVQTSANNAVILGGDLHDSWAWQLYDKGEMSGKPVAINLGCPGVTSPGWGPFVGGTFLGKPIEAMLGGAGGVYKFLSDMWELQNEGLVYGNVEKKGFFAVKATKTTHTTEYFLTGAKTTLQNFTTARSLSGGITGEFVCDSSLVTTAGSAGSLNEQAACSAITFMKSRPSVWDLPVPIVPLVSSVALTNCGMDGCVSKLATTPVLPVTSAPVPVTPAPVLPVTPSPVRPVTPAPVLPVTPSPVRPVTPAPVLPVTPSPVRPVTPAPVLPVTPAPVRPVTPAPVQVIIPVVTPVPVNVQTEQKTKKTKAMGRGMGKRSVRKLV
jgi:hypothetical protein